MVRYCSVYGCLQNTKTNKNRRFFRFPSCELRCKHWMKAIDRMDLETKGVNILHASYFVCDLHFANSDCPKKYLRGDAVPTLFLPQLDGTSGTSKCTQTDAIMSCSCKLQLSAETLITPSPDSAVQPLKMLPDSSHWKRKLQLELPESKKRKSLQSITKNATNKDIDMFHIKRIIDKQKVLKRKCQENGFSHEYIMFALNIYLASPVAYRFLSETLCLPSIRMLQRRKAYAISTKFDESVIRYLQFKIRNLSESEKYCILCAAEVPLKRHLHYQNNNDNVVGFHDINEKQKEAIATKAFVVMARGLFSNWKQPLAFCFLSKSNNVEINTWLENIMAKIIEIGFNVCAFVSDQGSNFLNMAENKHVCPEQPFFFVNSKKIYYIFDVPHLTISLRNSLINNDFIYHNDDGSEQVASWDDIENMYDIVKGKNNKTSNKLTESHIIPNNLKKKHVKYAAQLLSQTVALTISTLVESGKLNEKCIGTTKFIKLINDTFDILNSSSKSDDYKYKKGFYQAEYQTNTLEEAQRIFSVLRVINRDNVDVTNKMTFIHGFLTSINAITSLASDLKTAGHNYILTQRLNNEPLEKFNVEVRQQAGNCRKPTAIQFLTAFNTIRHSEYASHADNLDQLLMSIEEAQNLLKSQNVSKELSLRVGTDDYKFELPENNAFTYVCGYLLKKCYERHKDCEVMKKYIKNNEQIDDNNLFIDFKQFGAINPPADFIDYIKQIDSIAEDHFRNRDLHRVGGEIMTKISATVFNLPCLCFPLEYLKKLFVRFRIYNLMRNNNKHFADKSYKNKYFSVSSI